MGNVWGGGGGGALLTDLIDLVIQKHRQRTNVPLEISVEELVSINQTNNGLKCCHTKGMKINNSNAHRVGCRVSLILDYKMNIIFFVE